MKPHNQFRFCHNCLSVDYGPITFSLKFNAKYVRKESDKTAIHDSSWQADAGRDAWPSFEIYPGNTWNFGLILGPDHPTHSFTIETKACPKDNYPFTVDASPSILKVQAKKIPAWTMGEHDLVGELQNSPAKSDEPTENIELIPMGAARLRISAFPAIGEGSDAASWEQLKE